MGRKYYAVAVGRETGVFDSWAACEKQVRIVFGICVALWISSGTCTIKIAPSDLGKDHVEK